MSEQNNNSDFFEDETVKKPHRSTRSTTTKTETYDDEKIERQLTNIYKDASGRMPDMKKIRKVHSGSFIGGLFKFIFTIALLAALAWAGFFFLPTASKYTDSQVELSITGPENFSIGATTTYQIVFKNNQKVSLNNVNLTVTYPAGFIYSNSNLSPINIGKNEWNIDNIEPNEEKTVQITGNSFGSLGDASSWRVLLNYTPANFKSEMQKIATLNVKPLQTPINISLTGVDKIALDTPAKYTITVESKDDLKGKNLEIIPIFPASFSITSSSVPLQKNIWKIQPSSSTTDGSKFIIYFTGKFSSTNEDIIPLKVQIKLANSSQGGYLLSESVLNTEILKNSLAISTAVNGSLSDFDSKPGEILNFTISLKNAGKEDISKAQIKLAVEAPSYNRQSVLDWGNIVDKNDGNINGVQLSEQIRQAILVWNDKKITKLSKIKAGDEVLLDFQLPIKSSEKTSWNNVENNQIKITTELTFTDSTKTTQTIDGNQINITLNSDLSIQVKNEVGSDSLNRERHEITWLLNNTFHPLKNIVVSADLYGDVDWSGPSTASAGVVDFDTKTKRLTWTIPEMTENTDVLDLPFTVILNKKNPTQNTLISKVRISADDTISGKKIEFTADEIFLGN